MSVIQRAGSLLPLPSGRIPCRLVPPVGGGGLAGRSCDAHLSRTRQSLIAWFRARPVGSVTHITEGAENVEAQGR